jgi:hypothetical protein
LTLSPASTIQSSAVSASPAEHEGGPIDLDTEDELALRDLLLGVLHLTIGHFSTGRTFLLRSVERQNDLDAKWVTPIAVFELAVLELKEREADQSSGDESWLSTLNAATAWLGQALSLLNNTVDMQSRLDTRITMLKDEIASKRLILSGAPGNLPPFTHLKRN